MKTYFLKRIWRIVILAAVLLSFGLAPVRAVETPVRPVVYPAAMKPGDTLRFVAPAGPLQRKRVMLAKERLEKRGFIVQLPENLFRKNDYLAGSDQERADELMAAFADAEVDAIFPGTGGYGATRILDLLDYDVIRANPKILVGYSDITALHVAISQKAGVVTFHSPTPMYGLGSPEGLAPFSARLFWRAVLASEYPSNPSPDKGYTIRIEPNETAVDEPVTLVPGVARGPLVGGNLSVVHAMMGTPYEIDTTGRILFLEDVGEAPYRVDRMLQTMKLAGKLDSVAGVVLGGFTRRDSEDTDGEVTTVDQVLRDFFENASYPVLSHFPCGHQRNNATLPMGVLMELDSAKKTLKLLENPVRLPASHSAE